MDKDWHKSALYDYFYWEEYNQDIVDRIDELLSDIEIHPFTGIGKPEPLKGNLRGYWSRRITEEHRLVYKVKGDLLIIIRCRGHYK
jgi:toxin YoeB